MLCRYCNEEITKLSIACPACGENLSVKDIIALIYENTLGRLFKKVPFIRYMLITLTVLLVLGTIILNIPYVNHKIFTYKELYPTEAATSYLDERMVNFVIYIVEEEKALKNFLNQKHSAYNNKKAVQIFLSHLKYYIDNLNDRNRQWFDRDNEFCIFAMCNKAISRSNYYFKFAEPVELEGLIFKPLIKKEYVDKYHYRRTLDTVEIVNYDVPCIRFIGDHSSALFKAVIDWDYFDKNYAEYLEQDYRR